MIPLDDFVTSQFFQSLAKHRADGVRFDPEIVQPGDVIYARGWPRFFRVEHPRIRVPYILISNFHDRTIDHIPEGVDDSKLLHWYGVNMAVGHDKMTPIPLSLDAQRLRWMKKAQPTARVHEVYLNFSKNTRERTALYEALEGKPGVHVVTRDKRQPERFFQDVAASKFVLCPQGVGVDTYRIWESIALGAIPIIKKSFLTRVLEGITCVVVTDWEEQVVSPMAEYQPKQSERLTKAYWRNEISAREVTCG